MNKLNRVLSLLICFAMVVISIPGIALVSADDNFATEFVIVDNTEYASFDDATNWSFPGSEYADVDVDEEGNITYTQTKQTIYVNGSQNQIRTENLVYTLPESVVAEDEANRTKITTNKAVMAKSTPVVSNGRICPMAAPRTDPRTQYI